METYNQNSPFDSTSNMNIYRLLNGRYHLLQMLQVKVDLFHWELHACACVCKMLARTLSMTLDFILRLINCIGVTHPKYLIKIWEIIEVLNCQSIFRLNWNVHGVI